MKYPSRITAPERDAIAARFAEVGRSDEAVDQIAREFGRAVSTIKRLRRGI
jgi:IS30 family transposase